MLVYVLRHGIAVPRGTVAFPKDDRPLRDEGREKMAKAAGGIARIVETIDVIVTSPMKRAADTARIAAEEMGAERKVEICNELAPGKSVKNLMTYLGKYKGLHHLMIVGHEPDMGFIASSLLGSTASIIEFKKGALCCIEVATLPPKTPGKLLWHLTPKQLRILGK